jgi:hypothetical protein
MCVGFAGWGFAASKFKWPHNWFQMCVTMGWIKPKGADFGLRKNVEQ